MTYEQIVKAAGYELHWFAGKDSAWINTANEALSVHILDGKWDFYDWQKNGGGPIQSGETPETLAAYLAK